MLARGQAQARVLRHFGLLGQGRASHKRRGEHDARRRDDLEGMRPQPQVLVVKIRQAHAQAAVQVLRLGPLPDGLHDFLGAVTRQGAPLVDQLAQHAIALLLIDLVGHQVGRQADGHMQQGQEALHGGHVGLGLAGGMHQQLPVAVEGHPLRQIEAARRRHERHQQLAPAGISAVLAFFGDGIRRGGDGRFRLVIRRHRQAGDLFPLRRRVLDRVAGRQQVADQVFAGREAQQTGADDHGPVGRLLQLTQALAHRHDQVGADQPVDQTTRQLLAKFGRHRHGCGGDAGGRGGQHHLVGQREAQLRICLALAQGFGQQAALRLDKALHQPGLGFKQGLPGGVFTTQRVHCIARGGRGSIGLG